jgi:uncharacterized membrane protein (UPF0136 family)
VAKLAGSGGYGMDNTMCNRLLVSFNVCQVKHRFTVPISLVLVCGVDSWSRDYFGGVVLLAVGSILAV